MMSHDVFIRRCLDLARLGQGLTGINPMVGAVLGRDSKIIAEAFHSAFGKPHAERELLEKYEQNIRSKDTLYVNLEPCCHTKKKTPPCVPLIIQRGVKRVVFGMYDPNPEVSGKGVKMLKDAGVQVTGPVLPAECERLNRGFVSVIKKGRPWITLKSARTGKGEYANPKKRLIITNQEQDIWTHQYLRARHDAILVGIGTILADDPRLDVYQIKNPPQNYRIILDKNLKIPASAKVLGSALAPRTIVITEPKPDKRKIEEIKKTGARVIEIKTEKDVFSWSDLWGVLTSPKGDYHGISSILLEGGIKTWELFRKSGMIDEEVTLIGLNKTK